MGPRYVRVYVYVYVYVYVCAAAALAHREPGDGLRGARGGGVRDDAGDGAEGAVRVELLRVRRAVGRDEGHREARRDTGVVCGLRGDCD
ncbi:hypothetical protein KEM55_006053 [Ascosphaera atra]|nr:hypothetical protein KEM55_006053 [Ascosphaera atra]